jgi:capsular exopolysaccharide synthesis family protein
MSRIDDALKRMAEDRPARPTLHPADAAHRPSDGATLDHFPLETHGVPTRAVPAALPRPAALGPSHGPNPARIGAGIAPSEVPAVSSAVIDADVARRLVVNKAASHIVVEQYRRLAAALHDAQIERGLKTLMVTSALPREGKTLTAVNLALTLSDSYARRVLLVDADLRKPSVHEVLGLANDKGLSEALAGERGASSLVKVSGRFSVLPAGQPGPAPLAGLTSDRMRELLDQFEAEFDWIILDTPPVGFLPDGQLLARLTRAVVFVIGAGSSQYPAVERAVADLGRDCIIGTVLNRVNERVIPARAYYEAYQRTEPL